MVKDKQMWQTEDGDRSADKKKRSSTVVFKIWYIQKSKGQYYKVV